ncbi:MAG: inner membrane protein YiaA [Bacteroidota bacterium]
MNEIKENKEVKYSVKKERNTVKPSNAFIGASWTALIAGVTAYFVGLWNAEMLLSEKGYYFIILLFGLFSVVSVQKSVRDKLEGIPVTEIYYGLSWFCTITAIVLLVIGLWNAELTLSEKGFYAMSYVLGMFSAIAVQKNTRDMKLADQ